MVDIADIPMVLLSSVRATRMVVVASLMLGSRGEDNTGLVDVVLDRFPWLAGMRGIVT